MTVDQILTGFIFLAVVLVLLVIGKWVFDALHRRFVLRVELLENANLALALAVGGYYVGLAIVLGGVAYGPASFSVLDDVISLVVFGLLGIALLNLSAWINDRVCFRSSTTSGRSSRTATPAWEPSKAATTLRSA